MTTNNLANNRAIGIFDSGLGGLSVAKQINALLPHEDLIYVADSQHAPYGEKSKNFIIERVNVIAQQLVQKQCKAIVVACNTATVNAIAQLRQQLNIPIIGVEPAIKPAEKLSKNQKIAVLVTQSTSENRHFHGLINKYQNNAQFIIQPCPGLMEVIEQGQQNTLHCQQLLKRYIEPLLEQGIDTLVLGCTHYPFLSKQILAITEQSTNNIVLLETAKPVAEQLKNKLAQFNIQGSGTSPGNITFFSSSTSPKQEQVIHQLWQHPVKIELLPN